MEAAAYLFLSYFIGTFFQQIYNTADAMVVGRFVGKEALACVGGSTAQIINLIVGFFVGLSSGATVVLAQYYGAKDENNVSRAMHTAAAFAIMGGLIITVLGIILTPQMLALLNTPETSWKALPCTFGFILQELSLYLFTISDPAFYGLWAIPNAPCIFLLYAAA